MTAPVPTTVSAFTVRKRPTAVEPPELVAVTV
jgi:hypothetical protein